MPGLARRDREDLGRGRAHHASVDGEPGHTPEAGVSDMIVVHLAYAVELLDRDRASEAIELRSALAWLNTT